MNKILRYTRHCDNNVKIINNLLGALEGFGLDTSYLHGQAFDRAGNMAGKYRGASAIIKSTCPKAV